MHRQLDAPFSRPEEGCRREAGSRASESWYSMHYKYETTVQTWSIVIFVRDGGGGIDTAITARVMQLSPVIYEGLAHATDHSGLILSLEFWRGTSDECQCVNERKV